MGKGHNVALLGTGLIAEFYASALQQGRRRDTLALAYSRSAERAGAFARRKGIERHTNDLAEAVCAPGVDTVVVALPNDLHAQAVQLAVEAGKAVLCTKPLGRDAAEARQLVDLVERAGVFGGYLEDLCYTPKTIRATALVRQGSVGDVLWVRSREAHPGPHSAWFWDPKRAGGGAVVDLGCHCIEIIRNFVGKQNRPLEVMCWSDTLVHPVEAEDHAVGLIRFETGALGQFEVSWGFRGGMDLRDEVCGTEGTIWLNHFLRTGFELYATGTATGYVAEKAESTAGWVFPVGDEVGELGYLAMFDDMFDALDQGRPPAETFYDGYVVNAVIDACYRSATTKAWSPVELEWRHEVVPRLVRPIRRHGDRVIVKEEVLPDGRRKLILKDEATGAFEDRVVDS
jgi:predicted dehydrogenase